MKHISLRRSPLAAAVLLTLTLLNAGQTKTRDQVFERDVRSGMGFLASDAMQGRASGTIFERIAAEYIGSQFMQFGLEPAGETGFDGKPTFVQTVDTSRQTFAAAPVLKYYDKSLVHGNEMVVIRTNASKARGSLQPFEAGMTPKSGAAVVLRAKEGEDQRASIQAAQKMITAGASVVLIEETPAIRANWPTLTARMPSFGTTNAKPAVIAVIGKAVAQELAGEADGLVISFEGTLAPAKEQQTWNAMGKISGSDPKLKSEIILLTSHLDHLGVRESSPGEDKIFNGADDDASGTVAVLELARVLAAGPRPKRTVYFVCFGSEEAGGYGASYFVANMPFQKEKLVANIQFEMIGRPDPKVKPGELWLTGYERSNLGPELAKRGAKLVPDPHPEQNFFQRSDNIQLARAGIIAQTVSSFGLHADYHRASDEISTIDFPHMTRSINSMILPVKWLINSPYKPEWNPGMKP